MAKDIDLAKRIWEHIQFADGIEFTSEQEGPVKRACLAAARDILGKDWETGKRDLIFEALCDAMGADWKNMTKHEAARYNVAAKQLREIGATTGEVMNKARRYEFQHPDWPLTPTALISHWSTLSNSATRKVSAPDSSGQAELPDDVAGVELVGPPPGFMETLRKVSLPGLEGAAADPG
jgi:hypothetical protein